MLWGSPHAKNPWYLQIQQTLPQVLRPLYLALKAFDQDKARAVFQQNRPLWQNCAWNIEPLRPFVIIFWKPPWCVSETFLCLPLEEISIWLWWHGRLQHSWTEFGNKQLCEETRDMIRCCEEEKLHDPDIFLHCITLLPLKCLFKLKVWKTWADGLTDWHGSSQIL